MAAKKLEYTRENLRLLASIISEATSNSLFSRLIEDGGWIPEIPYQLAGKNKEIYLYDEFTTIGNSGRLDILDYITTKTVAKSSVYFKKKIGKFKYFFPKKQFDELKKKMKLDKASKPVVNDKLFRDRKFHKSLVFVAKELFVNSHYSQAIFEGCKVLENLVKKKSGLTISGVPLMQQAFSVNKPILKFNQMTDQSERDEQAGLMQIYAGVMQGIRDPKGHSIINLKDREKALEYLSLISLLLRRLDEVTT